MMDNYISDGEVRIMSDGFFMSVNKKRLQKDGYRLYLWNEWKSLWKHRKEYIGTREDFEKMLENWEDAA